MALPVRGDRPKNFNEFVGFAVAACKAAPQKVEDTAAVFIADVPNSDSEGGVQVGVLLRDGPPPQGIADQVYASAEKWAGFGVITGYAKLPEDEISDHWLLVCVEGGSVARFVVWPVGNAFARPWYIDPLDAPWMAASTAGSLRKMLELGEPMVFKEGRDRRLFNRPSHFDEEPPPTDERGFI